jgi:hypothetical protein
VTGVSEAEGLRKPSVSRILRLALLAPDIVETILDGRSDQALMLEQLERPLPTSWEEQRTRFLARSSAAIPASAAGAGVRAQSRSPENLTAVHQGPEQE